MQDVNMNAGSVDAQSASENQSAQTQQPAEALNTGIEERIPSHIPYERFKEVNEQLKGWKQYEGKQELIDSYVKFDEFLSGNPQAMQAIKMALQMAQGEPQQEQPMGTAQKLAYDNYVGEFERFLGENQIPEELKPVAYSIVESLLLRMNPDPLNNYDMGTMKKALAAVKNLFEQIHRTKQATYIEEKRKDSVPPSPSRNGVAPMQGQPKFTSREDRMKALAEGLTA